MGKTAYDDVGSGTPFVLLHGFPLDRSMWREQVHALSGTCRVIAPDLRGQGETPLGEKTDAATMEEMAADVAALLDELNVNRAVVGGLSMGGYVALAFRRAFPGRVGALILADTRAGADTDDARRTREQNARRALSEGMAPIADAMLPKLLSAETLDGKPDVVERVRAMILAAKPEGAAAALRGMARRRDQTDLLEEIDVPTLIIVGRDDAVTPPAEAEAMRDKVEGSRLVVVEGAGHLSNVERPEEFNLALVDFLRGMTL